MLWYRSYNFAQLVPFGRLPTQHSFQRVRFYNWRNLAAIESIHVEAKYEHVRIDIHTAIQYHQDITAIWQRIFPDTPDHIISSVRSNIGVIVYPDYYKNNPARFANYFNLFAAKLRKELDVNEIPPILTQEFRGIFSSMTNKQTPVNHLITEIPKPLAYPKKTYNDSPKNQLEHTLQNIKIGEDIEAFKQQDPEQSNEWRDIDIKEEKNKLKQMLCQGSNPNGWDDSFVDSISPPLRKALSINDKNILSFLLFYKANPFQKSQLTPYAKSPFEHAFCHVNNSESHKQQFLQLCRTYLNKHIIESLDKNGRLKAQQLLSGNTDNLDMKFLSKLASQMEKYAFPADTSLPQSTNTPAVQVISSPHNACNIETDFTLANGLVISSSIQSGNSLDKNDSVMQCLLHRYLTDFEFSDSQDKTTLINEFYETIYNNQLEIIRDKSRDEIIGFNVFRVNSFRENGQHTLFLDYAYADIKDSPLYRGQGIMAFLFFRPAYCIQALLKDAVVGMHFTTIHYNSFRLIEGLTTFPYYHSTKMLKLFNRLYSGSYVHDKKNHILFYINDGVQVKAPLLSKTLTQYKQHIFYKEKMGLDDTQSTLGRGVPALLLAGEENFEHYSRSCQELKIDLVSHLKTLADKIYPLISDHVSPEEMHRAYSDLLTRDKFLPDRNTEFWDNDAQEQAVLRR